MSEIPIRTVAVIQRPLSELTYRVALPNGKEIVGHLARDLRSAPPSFSRGDRVDVEMTPYDFSKARITGAAASGG